MRIDVVTLFPELFSSLLDISILARARKRGFFQLCGHNLRAFADPPHYKVDDTVYGGGKGMLLKPEPIAGCFEAIKEHICTKPHMIYMSPRGRVLTQDDAKRYAGMQNLVILCGHYEGVDERVLEKYIDEEVSVGDYVLTGGELPAMILIDAVSRLLPGVLSDEACFQEESHYSGLLEHPQYTHPECWSGKKVPEVLTSGNHKRIAGWKREASLEITRRNRQDMYLKHMREFTQ